MLFQCFILTGDIDFGEYALSAIAGQTYTIDGKDYQLVDAYFYGAGTVDITADLTGNVDSAYDGISAFNNSKVTVNGNVTAGDDGVDADDKSQITVNGNITAEDDGVNTFEKSQVTVNGNVEGGDYGINANEESQVTATAKEGYRLAKVMVSGSELQPVNGVYSFVMPENGHIEVSAEFVKIDSDSSKDGTVKTGDHSQIALLMLLLEMSGLATVVTYRKK